MVILPSAFGNILALFLVYIAGKSFIVNKPFIFAIKEKYTNTIVFIGKVMEPEYEE